MNKRQYQILLDLYHQYNEAFKTLDESIKVKFFKILYHQEQPTN